MRLPLFQRSRHVACYLPTPHEVDTWPVILRAWRMKKRVYAPVTVRGGRLAFRELRPCTRFVTADFGILEPSTGRSIRPVRLDMVITPLVAFDESCARIGMGGGYYDRSFSFLKHRSCYLKPKLIGVAFACQRVKKILINPWDIRLFAVITESHGW